MTSAERELRSLKLQLLLARAAAERAQIALQLEQLDGRTRVTRHIVGSAVHGAQRLQGSTFFSIAATALRLARRQPWLVPAIVAGTSKLARSRSLQWMALAAVVAAGVWWVRRSRTYRSDATGTESMQGRVVPSSGREPDESASYAPNL